MNIFLIVASLVFNSGIASAAEWCPTYQGRFPNEVIDLGQTQFFVFYSSGAFRKANETVKVMRVANRRGVFLSAAAKKTDWFSNTIYSAKHFEISYDSVTFDFDSAWFKDHNGIIRHFKNGSVRLVDAGRFPLVCAESR